MATQSNHSEASEHSEVKPLTYVLPLSKEDILLIMDALCHATMPDFKVGRQYKGKMTYKTEAHLAELYQTVGQAMGESDISLQFRVTDLATDHLDTNNNVSNPPQQGRESEKQ